MRAGRHRLLITEKRLCLAREKGIIVLAADREGMPGAGSREEHMRPVHPRKDVLHIYE
jgi:hypothetical protein